MWKTRSLISSMNAFKVVGKLGMHNAAVTVKETSSIRE